jgi:hypothetical protein
MKATSSSPTSSAPAMNSTHRSGDVWRSGDLICCPLESSAETGNDMEHLHAVDGVDGDRIGEGNESSIVPYGDGTSRAWPGLWRR